MREDKDYTRRMTGEGNIFKERQREQVLGSECRKELAKGSLVVHRKTHNGMDKGGLVQEGDEKSGGNDPRTYSMAFTAKVGPKT